MGQQMADGRPRRTGSLVEVEQAAVSRDQDAPRGRELGHRRPAKAMRRLAAARQDAARTDDHGRGVVRAPGVDRGQDVIEVGHRAKRSRGQTGPGRLAPRRLAPPVDGAFARRGHAGTMHFASGRRTRAVAPLLAALLILLTASVATATEFPAGRTGYHSYTEVTAEVAALAAAHPDIVHRFSIGKSYKGRDIWAVKISDNVGVDEAEPEVMFDGGHHANEHMSAEMTLSIMHWLVDGYGHDTRITNIVDTREVWIVFVVNPDGKEFDISGGRFHNWRKNRQPTPGTTSIGTDLNRNYSYHWGGGGRTSASPSNITYRGTKAFSTPEARAMRDFMASRVVGGRQQIRAAASFHEDGRLVMWPYGYTMTNVPSDMTAQDRAALATHRPEDGLDQRLHAHPGERPVHQLRHVARLPVRRLPDLRLHVRDVAQGLPG